MGNEEMVFFDERVRVVLEHARLHVAQYGERGLPAEVAGASEPNGRATGRQAGIVSFRKHLSWYFKASRAGENIPGLKQLREQLVRVNSLEELNFILNTFQINLGVNRNIPVPGPVSVEI